MEKAKTGQRPSVQRNFEITQIESEILAKSQNEHKPEKGLAHSLIRLSLVFNSLY